MTGLTIDFETADRITVSVMKEQLDYLLRDQRWFEASEEEREALADEFGYKPYVHPEDYATNASKYIPALKLLIDYFGGR